MEIYTDFVNGVSIISLVGELDGNTAPDTQQTIQGMISAGARIILDMTQLAYMSSAGARALLVIYRQISEANAAVILAGLSPEIADMLSATGFLEYFQLAATVDDGLAAFGA